MNIVMGWPEWIYVGINILGLLISVSEHGKPQSGTKNAVPSVIALLIVLPLLYWGGFFS